jgi:hypothetical protein
MRSIREAFVVAPPTGARIRTRLRPTQEDEDVLRAVGAHLGRLASADLAARCRLGRGTTQRTARKRALTAQSTSRWAGSITRTSNDQWERALANLADHRISLRRAVRVITARLAVPIGTTQGRIRGYASVTERTAKQRRLQHLLAQIDELENRLALADVSVCRGGLRLAKQRHSLDRAGISEEQWRACWHAARWFLTADGDAEYPLGNGTIQVHPEQQWLELRLPTPLAHLANRPHGRYRLAAPVSFSHRKDEWATQTNSGAVRYDISLDTTKRRWYVDASWRVESVEPPPLEELRRQRVLGVDLNADHLACWPLDDSGNPISRPYTIPMRLSSLPARTRDGRLRSAWRNWYDSPPRAAASPSPSKTWTLPKLARLAGKLSVVDTVANGSAASSPVSRPADLALWSLAWPPIMAFGSSRWIRAGPPNGDAAIGRHH